MPVVSQTENLQLLLSAQLTNQVSPEHIALVLQALEGHGVPLSPGVSQRVPATEALVESLQRGKLHAAEIMSIWRTHDVKRVEWQSPVPYRLLAQRLIVEGAPFAAREVASAGLALDAENPDSELLHLKGLALARSGAVEEALRVLQYPALAHIKRNEELSGLEARIEKDLGLADLARKQPEAAAIHFRRSRNLYYQAWTADDGTFWTGINVATLHFLMGERAQALDVARQITKECLEAEEKRKKQKESADETTKPDDPYWLWATLGEAYLDQCDLKQAEHWYREAASVSAGRAGNLNSSRRQLKVLLEALGEDIRLVDEWLPIPKIAVFTGHRIDEPGRQPPRFPSVMVEPVRAAISQWIREHNVRIGFCSAACGADLLFLEALQALPGSITRVVLPYAEEQFIPDSVARAGEPYWKELYHRVLEKAAQVIIASPQRIGPAGTPFAYANRVLLGQAMLCQQEFQTSLLGLAVWNGQPGDGPGGTGDTVAHWRDQDLTVYTIDLSSPQLDGNALQALPVRCEGPECPLPVRSPHRDRDSDPREAVMSMLFADAVGFSGLSDQEVRLFIPRYLQLVADVVAKHSAAVANANHDWSQTSVPIRETWGDGLYFAFQEVACAGSFALDLCDSIRQTRWIEDVGLSREIEIRIALHAGPVQLGQDPVTGLPKCIGSHVSRAARLEPKTPPGEVYASDAFAALAAQLKVTNFACEYVKLLEWAKHHGTYPTYVVRRCPDE